MITVGGKQPDLYKQQLKSFENAAKEAGKKPADMPRLIELNVEYVDDEQTAIQYQKKYWAGTYVPALFDQKIYTPKMSAQNGEVVGADSIKKSACVSRNADDHVKFVKQYIDLGFNTIYFHSATPNQKNFIDAYARDVLPQLRRHAH